MTKKLATVADVKKMVPGKTKIRITNRVNGHPYNIGEVLTFQRGGGGSTTYISVEEGGTKYWIYNNEYEIIQSRTEEADILETEIASTEKELEKMKEEVTRLRKYKDDNDELAHLISETIKSDGSPESIYTLLTKFNISK